MNQPPLNDDELREALALFSWAHRVHKEPEIIELTLGDFRLLGDE
jgi:hypothetical protein